MLELIDTGNGHTARYKGRYLYSRVDPKRDALRRVERFLSDRGPELPGSLVFVPSLGLGHGLADLMEGVRASLTPSSGVPSGCHVLCVEVDESLFAAAIHMKPRLFPDEPGLTVVRTDSPRKLAALLRNLGVDRFRRVLIAPLCSAYEIDRPRYDTLASTLQDEIRIHWQNKMTLVRLGGLWVRNLITNLAALPSACDWRQLRVDGPVVVAGAGPSLDGAIDRIRTVRDQVALLAVDTAVAPLLRRGLEPDIVLVLDAQVANLLDFVGVRMDRLAVMADLSSSPAILRRAGRLYLYATRFAPLRFFDRLENRALLPSTIPAMGSVGVAALHAALALTSGPVLLAGLDFAYTSGRTHARGTPGDARMNVSADRLHPTESQVAAAIMDRRPFRRAGRDRNDVLTDLILQGYAGQAARIVASENRVYSLGGSGLDIGAPLCDGLPDGASAAVITAPETCRRWSRAAVRDLVREEMERVAVLQRPGEREAALVEQQIECDYLTIDWPTTDLSGGQAIAQTSRFRRAVAICADLWQRTAARLEP